MSENIIVSEHEHVCTLVLNNPPAHTWTPESLVELKIIIENLNKDSSNRALVIRGQGDTFFCAGADLKEFDHQDSARCERFADAFRQAFTELNQYRGISIAAINGYAMGGGLELAMCCDIRIAEQHAVLALPECGVGLLPCGLGTQNLPKLVGEQWAKRMILLGEKIDAKTALEIGLVSEMVDSGESEQKALSLTQSLQRQSPSAVDLCKTLIMGARDTSMKDMIQREHKAFLALFDTQDRQEGVSAFLEKRTPKWSNR